MADQPSQSEPPHYWAQSAPASRWQHDASPFRRFIGGSPLGVLIKLIVVSLLVGGLLVWLDIRPGDVFRELTDLVDRLWSLSFRSLREFGNYILAGAAIVVPVWFVLRLLSFRGR